MKIILASGKYRNASGARNKTNIFDIDFFGVLFPQNNGRIVEF
jgi:hypothetical protein